MKKNGPIMKACAFFRLDVSGLPKTSSQALDEMEAAGIDRGVILGQDTHATRNSSFKNYTIRNDELAALAKGSHDRLVPFAGVDPHAGSDAVKELKRAAKVLGMKGLKMHSSANSVYPNDRKLMFPIYDFCQEAGLPILFHTGTTGLGDCEIRFSKPEYLDEVCEAYPDLKLVMAHFGWPWSDVAMAVALRHQNVFIDVSGWKPKHIPPGVVTYLNGALKERFLFGTDYPMIRHSQWLEDFDTNLRPRLKPGVADKLLSGNAKRLLAG